MSSSSNISTFDEQKWIIQIRQTFDEDNEEYDDTEFPPVSIFNVPKSLMASNPDSYTPQEVAIGPYHYCRPELYEMERYKISAARRAQRRHQTVAQFQHLVEQLLTLERRIRACYHKDLDFSGETLAWKMAIDASFLLEFLQVYSVNQSKGNLTRVSSKMSHLFNYGRRKSAHYAILKDIMMLENQIPLFVLRKALEFRLSYLESSPDDMLVSMLMGLCKELSPFKTMSDLPNFKVSECTHLLDFLYNKITPKWIEVEDRAETAREMDESQVHTTCSRKYLSEVQDLLKKLSTGPISYIKKAIVSRPVKFIFTLPLTILSNFPAFVILKQSVVNLVFSETRQEENCSLFNRPPLVEEITIPSVTELDQSGITFLPSNGGIIATKFDPKEAKFDLPVISLDENTEIVLRNLVAYESSNASGPLILTRYTELMNGIIDTEEDVKLLRERGIILNHLKSDEEVTKMWNGMSKSIRLTKVGFLDTVIEDVNLYYNGKWRVKVGRFVKKNLFDSWGLLTLLAAFLLLYVMGLQAFLTLYRSSH